MKGAGPRTSPEQEATERQKKRERSQREWRSRIEAAKIIDAGVFAPSFSTVSTVLTLVRAISCAINIISDCDETFNYWEPTHFLLHGKGLQTWEYSPEFSIRSYSYIVIHAAVGWLQNILNPLNKMAAFYIVRMVLAFFCSYCEASLYHVVMHKVSKSVARVMFLFLMFSPGMFLASTAYLPSSFCMYFVMLGYTAWLNGRRFTTILMFAVGVIYGWPFSGVLGVPIAIDFALRRGTLRLLLHGLLSLAILLPPCLLVDWHYYRRLMLVPLNIVVYNVFSSGKGPELYGTEPPSFYLINGFLNYNFAFFLSLVSLPLLLLVMRRGLFEACGFQRQLERTLVLQLLPLYLWLAIFFSQPHKEERFLFPVYPLIAFQGALAVACLDTLIRRGLTRAPAWLSMSPYLLVLGFVILGVSRIAAVSTNYMAPLNVYENLYYSPEVARASEAGPVTVCVGKEWYRFPGHFFFPNRNVSLAFLKSEFAGLLPKYYESSDEATWTVPQGMNDLNQEDTTRYVLPETCHFLVDQVRSRGSGARRPVPRMEPGSLRPLTEEEVEGSFRRLFCSPFLDPTRSPSLTRAFYLPLLSSARNVFNDYCLYANPALVPPSAKPPPESRV